MSTLVTLDMEELLLIKRSLHATKVSYEDSQREQIFNSEYTIWVKGFDLILYGGSCTDVASKTFIDKFQIPSKASYCILF